MALISEAILQSLMNEGVPLMIIPENMIQREDSLEESFESLIKKRKKKKPFSSFSNAVIPSVS